jgi:hypothetical protein
VIAKRKSIRGNEESTMVATRSVRSTTNGSVTVPDVVSEEKTENIFVFILNLIGTCIVVEL